MDSIVQCAKLSYLEKHKFRISIQNFKSTLCIQYGGNFSRNSQNFNTIIRLIENKFFESHFRYLKVRIVNYYFSVRRIKHFCHILYLRAQTLQFTEHIRRAKYGRSPPEIVGSNANVDRYISLL